MVKGKKDEPWVTMMTASVLREKKSARELEEDNKIERCRYSHLCKGLMEDFVEIRGYKKKG